MCRSKFCKQDQDALIAQLSEIIPALLEKTTFSSSSVRTFLVELCLINAGALYGICLCSQDYLICLRQIFKVDSPMPVGRADQAVRQAACRCLESFAELPVERVIPYKSTVTRGLKPALDDPKRRVRKVAAGAANAYHFLTV